MKKRSCSHKPHPGFVCVTYFRSDGETRREVAVVSCLRCGHLFSLGPSADGGALDNIPAGEIKAAGLIRRIDRIAAVIAPRLAADDPITAARYAAAGVLTLPELYGWGASEAFFGTPAWDAGWLAAAYFDHDPHQTETEQP